MVAKEVFVDMHEPYHQLLRSIRHFRRVDILFGLCSLDLNERIANPTSSRRISKFLRFVNSLYMLLIWGGLIATFLFWMWLLGERGDLGGSSLANVDGIASATFYGANFVAVLSLRIAWFWQKEKYLHAWTKLYNSPNLFLIEGIKMHFLNPLILFVFHTLATDMLVIREALTGHIIKDQVGPTIMILIGFSISSMLTIYIKMAGKIIVCYTYRIKSGQIKNLQELLKRASRAVEFNNVKTLFMKIEETAAEFNRVFTPLLIITIANDLIDLVNCLYFGITRLISLNHALETTGTESAMTIFKLLPPWCLIAVSLLELTWLCEEGQRLQNAMEEFRRELHKANTLLLDEEAKLELALFTTQLSGKVGTPSVGGFFSVNRRLFIGILGSITTYLIVLLQSNGSTQGVNERHGNNTT